ncbi:MAG: hypothetical protein AB1894_04875 [Chloroflexota bacterium]
MSDVWSYDLYVPSRSSLEPRELGDIQLLMKKVGFSPVNPLTGIIVVSRVDESSLELIQLEYEDLESISPSTRADGSILTIWKGNVDADIGFGLKPDLQREFRLLSERGNISVSRLSIMIDGTLFRDHDAGRNGIASDIQTLFSDLCDYFHARYGYSYNEGTAEAFFGGLNVWKRISLQGNPRQLFWLNFFPNERLPGINLKEMISLGGKAVNTKTGVFVFFSDHPWEIDLDSLRDLNNAWLRVLSQ